MNQTFQNSAQVISIGIFFTLMIIGLASSLPATLSGGLRSARRRRRRRPPRRRDAADLGPLRRLPRLQPDRAPGRRRKRWRAAGAHAQAALTGPTFFPHLISGPFSDGLDTAFAFAIVACLVAAGASLLRGGRYHHAEEPAQAPAPSGQIPKLEEQHAR